MKFLVISDTHGNIERPSKLIEKFHEEIHGVWHLGDNYRDFEMLKTRYALRFRLAFQAVPGNCDTFCDQPDRRVIPVEGHKVFMVHGDRFGVKTGTDRLVSFAASYSADVVLFGHTHVPLVEETNGILVLNPGSLSLPHGGSKASYALLTLESGKKPEAQIIAF